jgi:hypothetical protein
VRLRVALVASLCFGGVAAILFGIALIFLPAAIIAGGVGLLGAGLFLDRAWGGPPRRPILPPNRGMRVP